MVVCIGALVAGTIFLVHFIVSKRRREKRDALREHGVAFSAAMANDAQLSEMTIEQAAALLRGTPLPTNKTAASSRPRRSADEDLERILSGQTDRHYADL